MKITDFCIIFTLFTICFFGLMDFRQKTTYESLYLNNRYNVIMDNAVEDALMAAYENVDIYGKPEVNLNTASDYILDELSVMLSGNTLMSEYYGERVVCVIYTDLEGFYYTELKDNTGWSEKILFSSGEKTAHSDKVNEIEKFIYDKYKLSLVLPTNNGENYENTLEDYTLMSIYTDYDGMCCFSAAAIRSKEESSGE